MNQNYFKRLNNFIIKFPFTQNKNLCMDHDFGGVLCLVVQNIRMTAAGKKQCTSQTQFEE